MKKFALFFAAAVSIIAVSCKSDDDSTPEVTPVSVDLNFTHNWDGSNIENADFETTQYTNANGEELTLSKIVYLISDVTFTNSAGESFDAGDYNLVNVREEDNLTFTPGIQIPPGDYTVSFTFGFDDEDNIDAVYPDLNQTPEGSWGVPMMMGGGYHYMRLEGRFLDNTSTITGFQYHAIRANDQSTTPVTLQDTSIPVTLGQVTIGDNTTIEVKMNAAEWFKNPNQWDLNALPGMLMPNFAAQIMISENGASVFSLGAVTQ
ncbi:MbnP family protein [Ulvibacter litoralis]|uniref:Copper-binding protein MbnP-like domain-containing protein n=1 Tax=Ulvibacter litoralis TaxID=227084 RepID=A0A1G7CXZ4_9FLAO|nr:MbnP family protein [Ulvibacter litoralis]GHC45651.1 hypothetical protein GCM10008083_05630 [Ulvibacter litoralis]SDE44149.1 hypothetical protein SAMN05421855_101636 [Ulvibacter litoralis]